MIFSSAATTSAGSNERVLQPGYIDYNTHTGLLDDVMRGKREQPKDGLRFGRTDVSLEIRYHYAANSGAERFSYDESGFRTYFGFDTKINEQWRLINVMEMQNNIKNYDDSFDAFANVYVSGQLAPDQRLDLGKFYYMMADGNIYDSALTGARYSFGGPVKYAFAYGDTNDTKKTGVFTAKYDSHDFSLDAGVYRYEYKTNYNVPHKNTLVTLGAKYYFKDFTLGALFLGANKVDAADNKNGYILSLKYGNVKTWVPKTYALHFRYYDQPRGTYIAHGMNGMNGRGYEMIGFKGSCVGINYALAKNVLFTSEYYDLNDKAKVADKKNKSWFTSISFFF